ncbi:hypothetical protein QAD02_009698 [Eretmocerus hayati]|uniref:Uncharacterized protein n=1 Tax=Eretmocerus hayati TaxID=131215 RepID=A0ACC2NA42_9HYME|nr:hypothetical protein QAD02_009698 [Eretmocerus hayati]
MGEQLYAQLNRAVIHGQREEIDILLDQGAPVNFSSLYEYRSPLHSAVYLGDPAVVEKLLNKGASVNVQNHYNETTLTLAAKFEKCVLVDLLLSPKDLINFKNPEYLTHLHIACMRNKVDVIKKLIWDRADLNTTFRCKEVVEILLSNGSKYNTVDQSNSTAYDLIAMMVGVCPWGVWRELSIMKTVLTFHSKFNFYPLDDRGYSLLHLLCIDCDTEIETIREFIETNPQDLNKVVNLIGNPYNGYTPLHFAIKYENKNCAMVLIDKYSVSTHSRERC